MNGTHSYVRQDAAQDGRLPSGWQADHPCRRRPSTVIREVFLDLGGVLYDDSAWRRWLLHLVARMGLHTHYASFYRVWDCEFEPEVWSGRCGFWPALKRFLVAAGLTYGQAEEVEAGCRARFRDFEQNNRPFPAVAETLECMLAAGRVVTVVSHAPLSVEEIKARLAELHLLDCVTEVRGSEPGINGLDSFRSFRQCRPLPDAAVYVGRDPGPLATARQARLQTVAFNYDADVLADYYIEQFDELIGILDLGQPLRVAG